MVEERTEATAKQETETTGLDIAIIGMAGRFPGADNIREFWDLLKNGVEAITCFSDEELLASGVDPALLRDAHYIKSRCIINNEDKFDAYFFDISPREAELLDPQQRLFLEIAWQALENAGYYAETYQGLIGLFGGTSMNTYLFAYLQGHKGFISSAEGYQLAIGNDKDFLTTRVSYKMNLKGPSIDVQSACSTSLAAIHVACQNLLNFSCDMAMAGGVSITIPQKQGYYYQEGMILSADGHCRAFDEKASGTISGNGAGIVVLKRLEDALADNDHIYAVIKGSAFNNDGALRVGYTAPGVDGQAEVIGTAQSVAGVHPDSITYIETHGTGTIMGDPIEITALHRIFQQYTDRRHYCAIGSVKTNIGHLDAAAGVAGLIKTAQSLFYNMIPPSLNYQKPNPLIDFDNSPFFVNTQLRPWLTTNGQARRAGVSSFGIGGTNVHVVLEEAPLIEPSDPARPQKLLLLSAKTGAALEDATKNLLGYFKENTKVNLADAAFTLQTGRKPFTHRRMLVCHDVEDAILALENRDPKRLLASSHGKDPSNPPLAFMFSGQGAQYVNMGKELYEYEPVFREQIDLCCEILLPFLNLDLRTLLYPPVADEAEAQKRLDQTLITQPALFVIEYALAQQFIEWNLRPTAMAGHSIGEYVAACLSGVFSLDDALKLVAARGRLMQQMPAGAMLSVNLNEFDAQPFLSAEVALAAVNSKDASVLSGTYAAIEKLEKEFDQKSIKYRRLHTSHAFHSAMMDAILAEFTGIVQGITLHKPEVPYVSNVSGKWITEKEATDPTYYARHLRSTVRFADNVHVLLQESQTILLEIGPGTTLSTLARRHPSNTLGRVILASMRHPQEEISDQTCIMNCLGRLWLSGAQPDWPKYYSHERRLRLSLPTYPFERQRFWLESKGSKTPGLQAERQSVAEKNPDISDWFYIPGWKQRNLPIKPYKAPDKPPVWLVFKDYTGLAANFIAQLRRFSNQIITVEVGESFSESTPNRFTLNIENAADYHTLFTTLIERDIAPDFIAHFWNIAVVHHDDLPLESEHIPGYKSVLFLTQALAQHSVARRVQLGIITSHLFEITGYEPYKPGKAMVLGLAKVIPQEYPNITCRVIDVKLPQGIDDQLIGLSAQLAAEFTEARLELTTAYRGKQRWAQDFSSLRLEDSNVYSGYLKEDGVYLITGGLGRIGLALAEHLAATIKARLALIDYFDFPAQSAWENHLNSHPENDPTSLRIRSLQNIGNPGGKFLFLKADVGDADELKAAVNAAAAHYGRIDGVIHAAGMVGQDAFKSLTEIAEADWQSQFYSKVKGAQNLAVALADHKPEFVLLQSSMSSILGGLGFGAYAAANAYLDALAYQLNNQQDKTQWISVNWDGWNFERTPTASHALGAEMQRLAILPAEGLQAFDRIFTHKGLTQIVVSTSDLHDRIRKWVKLESLQTESVTAADSATLHNRPNLPTAFVAAQSDLEKEVAATWQKLLGVEPVGIYDNFFDLGGNSLMGTQLISQLRETFKIELPLRSLFEDPTISGVSKIIEQERGKGRDETQDKIADLLKQMESMSDEKAAELLRQRKDQLN
jgi:acyl transferase domain-containing protein/acyl carrier protein